jgi:hypothetical protein
MSSANVIVVIAPVTVGVAIVIDRCCRCRCRCRHCPPALPLPGPPLLLTRCRFLVDYCLCLFPPQLLCCHSAAAVADVIVVVIVVSSALPPLSLEPALILRRQRFVLAQRLVGKGMMVDKVANGGRVECDK